MKVRMLECLAGIDLTLNAGDIVELADATAERYVAAGIAEHVSEPTDEPKRETASKRSTSRAIKE
jgi:hypothetical protein